MVHGFVLSGLIKAGYGQAETLLKVAPPQFAIGDDGQAESGLFRHTGADGFVLRLAQFLTGGGAALIASEHLL